MSEPLVEAVKLIGGFAIALMSMAIATYALAIPRLQIVLSMWEKRLIRERERLEIDMKRPGVGVDEVEIQLEELKGKRKEVRKIIQRLSLNPVVLIPVACSTLTLLILLSSLLFSSGYDPYPIVFSACFLPIGLTHLLLSLRKIQQVAVYESEPIP